MIEANRPLVKSARGRARRFSKVAQQRIKIGLVALSVATFGGALGGIVAINPAIKSQAVAAGPEPVNIALPAEPSAPQISSAPLTLPSAPQLPAFRPRARTRGS